jgi:2-amino-4-hydroxy-6-hydroxymethyldihydropteridine diphosphokinase
MRASGEIVYVAIGANLGDREATFGAAITAIERERDLLLLVASPVYETPPLGPAEQRPYLNAVVQMRSWLGPVELLHRLQAIEQALGREREREVERWGPRTIDLDLLFFGERCVESPELVVPHARAHERIFVMAPMAEIAPGYVHPRLGVTVGEIVRSLPGAETVVPWTRPQGWPGAGREPAPRRATGARRR